MKTTLTIERAIKESVDILVETPMFKRNGTVAYMALLERADALILVQINLFPYTGTDEIMIIEDIGFIAEKWIQPNFQECSAIDFETILNLVKNEIINLKTNKNETHCES